MPVVYALSRMWSFSIHYWIVFLETLPSEVDRKAFMRFQYPLLDRISWNSTPWSLPTTSPTLSVSTIGSYFLKQLAYPLTVLSRESLSVSTIGSYFLKPAVTVPSPKRNDITFSIHYWIVFLETTYGFWKHKDTNTFSIHYWIVFLETKRGALIPISRTTFSIHYWIVFLETEKRHSLQRRGYVFQYPLLDRISWNSVILTQ